MSEFLNVPKATLVAWRNKRVGPRFSTVGRHVRYRWTDVEQWLDSQANDGARAVAR
ncbi:helix-turn-helix domain-containing protein [Crossiella sp. CA198]|uniref:helix-turn-helix domain-containing protein n=1 Tax=Crossiella sp. CA198 TaxID=3455607 RepID=UPI003F8CF8A8